MKIGYFADGPWSHRALELIRQQSDLQIVFIVARFDHQDPVLRKYAEDMGVPFLVHPNVNSADFIDQIKKFGVDLNVSMSFNQILKKDIVRVAPLGFINCHAGALPFYRGRNILNWALINGETQFGVTIIDVDDGIDTGDIILQKFAEISPSDDYASLLEKAYELCATTLCDALQLFAKGNVQRMPQSQIHPVGFYCCQRKPGDEYIDWNWSTLQIHNFIRAITIPGPGARTWHPKGEVGLIKSKLIPQAPSYIATPGEVVGRNQDGVVIKTGDSTIQICQIAKIEMGKSQEIHVPNWPIGTRLTGQIVHQLQVLEAKVAFLEEKLGNASQSTS